MSFSLYENAPLAPYCSMKVGGNAKYLVLPKNEAELLEAMGSFCAKGEKYIVVGNCSNLIFPDEGYDGAVIITTSMRGISINDGIITAYCGETLSTLARFACENSLSGLEFCYGIPGTVGGGIYMNAGAYGGELSDRFIKGTFLNERLEKVTLSAQELDFGYRKSRLEKEGLILISADFSGISGDKAEIRAKMDELMATRKAKQPLEFPSCGSAFKRPEGHFAGALIEQCGLKGFSVGGAQVSEKHAGFIINRNNATATDVLDLMEKVKEIVLDKTGITLEPEIRVIR
ncbi:MAG: UDP-N-acetylmuramate dehydrogenase [Ruminococcaceae bacterium]|nr:UDP-N-acetylmuramate dehydrogenase [Oscillospiraceae bacterium]